MNSEVPFSWRLALDKVCIAIAGVVLLLDQITKAWVVKSIEFGEVIRLFPGLNLIHTKNRGAAFGIFNSSTPSLRLVFFGIVTLICLYLVVYWLGTTPQKNKIQRWSLALILGGAIGNLIDRVMNGQVTDFIDVYFGTYHWYTFNIADSAISVGVTFIILSLIGWIKEPR